MDQQAEQMLRRRITAARPHDAIVGEEAAAKGGESGVTWLIDPIDGTVNYLYDIPAYCVSVAAVTGDASRRAGGARSPRRSATPAPVRCSTPGSAAARASPVAVACRRRGSGWPSPA